MPRRSVPVLPRLRGRRWRLAVLWLWAAIFVVNLAAAFDHPASAGSLAADQQASLCHSAAVADSPSTEADRPQTADSHCALCHIFAAGVLSTPGHAQVAVLAPDGGDAPAQATMATSPDTHPPDSQAQPRAPPRFRVI